jgi:hypothetical protein
MIIKIYKKLINITIDNGLETNKIGLYYKELAKIHCNIDENLSIEYYKQSVYYYNVNMMKIDKNDSLKEQAYLLSKNNNNNTIEAGNILQEIGNNSKYQYSKFYFHSLLCFIAYNDIVLSNIKINEILNNNYKFEITMEYKFITEIINSINKNNVKDFENACIKYDEIYSLSGWELNILTIIKNIFIIEQINEDVIEFEVDLS